MGAASSVAVFIKLARSIFSSFSATSFWRSLSSKKICSISFVSVACFLRSSSNFALENSPFSTIASSSSIGTGLPSIMGITSGRLNRPTWTWTTVKPSSLTFWSSALKKLLAWRSWVSVISFFMLTYSWLSNSAGISFLRVSTRFLTSFLKSAPLPPSKRIKIGDSGFSKQFT